MNSFWYFFTTKAKQCENDIIRLRRVLETLNKTREGTQEMKKHISSPHKYDKNPLPQSKSEKQSCPPEGRTGVTHFLSKTCEEESFAAKKKDNIKPSPEHKNKETYFFTNKK